MALAAVKGEKTLAELTAQFDVHANVIKTWRDQLLEGAAGVFGEGKPDASPPVDVEELTPRLVSWRWRTIFCPERSAKPVCWRAQSDDRHRASPSDRTAGPLAQPQPGQRLLSAAPGPDCRSCDHEPDRQVASGIAFCGQPDDARLPRSRELRRRAPAYRDADEADGHRSDLSAAESGPPLGDASIACLARGR